MWDCISWGLILVGGFQLGRLVVNYITNTYKTELYEKLIKIIDQPKENYEVYLVQNDKSGGLYAIKYKSGIQINVNVSSNPLDVHNVYVSGEEISMGGSNFYVWEGFIIESKLKEIVKEYINKCKKHEATVQSAKILDKINDYLKDK